MLKIYKKFDSHFLFFNLKNYEVISQLKNCEFKEINKILTVVSILKVLEH